MERSPETERIGEETLQTRPALLRVNTEPSTSEQGTKGEQEKEQKKERETDYKWINRRLCEMTHPRTRE